MGLNCSNKKCECYDINMVMNCSMNGFTYAVGCKSRTEYELKLKTETVPLSVVEEVLRGYLLYTLSEVGVDNLLDEIKQKAGL